ncbi:MAG: hypothetical protein KF691_13865 [Phycisphaeraceae bacterium]|nr:hypothetical protein [Phycisphaeraceae bacterium]
MINRCVGTAFLSLMTLVGVTHAEPCVPRWLPGSGAPGVDGAVYTSTMWDPDGAGPAGPVLVIGGEFEYVGATLCRNVATFDPQTGVWAPVGSGVNGSVSALAVQNGMLIAGGGFTEAGGVSALGLAKWNGTSWSAFSGWSGTYANVEALLVTPQNQLIVGGNFTTTSGLPGNSIARWSGTSWSTYGSGFGVTSLFAPHADVNSLLLNSSGEIVAGGTFDLANGASIKCVARWTGGTWAALGSGLDMTVRDMVLQPNGEIVAVGVFQNSGATPVSGIARWNGTSWSSLGSGLGGEGSSAAGVDLLPLANGNLVVSGKFKTAGGIASPGIAVWNGSTWSALGGGFAGGTNWVVSTTAQLPNGDLMTGGRFVTADGRTAAGLARWNGAEWNAIASGSDSEITALAVAPNGDVYAGGTFTMMNGVLANSIARWDGTNWHPLSTGMGTTTSLPPSILALAVAANGDVIAGGVFDSAGGVPTLNIARWNGSTWSPIGSGLIKKVNALIELPNGHIVAGGSFTPSGTTTPRCAMEWNGASWTYMGSELNNLPFAFVVMPNGDLIAGGMFAVPNAVKMLARWNGTAWENYAGSVLHWIHGMALAPNGDLIVGGTFTRVGTPSIPAASIARWNGTQWSTMGSGMAMTGGADVEAVAVLPSGDVVAAGRFTSAGGVAVSNIARWDGSTWSALDGGINDRGRAFAVLPQGGFMAGGNFSLAAGKPSKGLAQWTDARTPEFLQDPVAEHVCGLGTAAFSVQLEEPNDGLAVRWQLETASGSGSFVDLAEGPIPESGGAVAALSALSAYESSLQISDSTGLLNERRVRAVVSNSCGEVAGTAAALLVCSSDLQCDGLVDDADFVLFVEAYNLLLCDDPGMSAGCAADLNRDTVVDDSDFVLFVAAYDQLECP